MTNTALSILQAVASVDRLDDLSRLVRRTLFEAAEGSVLGLSPIVARVTDQLHIDGKDADTPAGNIIDAMVAPSPSGGQVAAVKALLLHSFRIDPPQGVDTQDDAVTKLVWLATHSRYDVFSEMDDVLGGQADVLWGALADFVARYRAPGSTSERSEALVAASALGASGNLVARARAKDLMIGWQDPTFVRLLRGENVQPETVVATLSPEDELLGQLSRAPSGVVRTTVGLVSGWRLLSYAARALAKGVLRYRVPARLRMTHRGVEVTSKVEMLGRVVRERTIVIPYQGLAMAKREVRFPRLATYAGIVAGLLGGFVGVFWMLGGIRGRSLTLTFLGLGVVLLGVMLDLLLTSWLPGRRGVCSVVVVPKKGRATCVASVDSVSADRLLKRLAS